MLNHSLPHVVALKGGSNFRDLGGYRTSDGRTVRRHAVFRSAHLGTLTDEDRSALGKLGVRTIVDLRGVNEAAETPHLVDGIECRIVGAHIEPGVGEKIRGAVADGTATPHLMMQFLTDHYRDYPRRCAPGFRTLFATLSDGTPSRVSSSAEAKPVRSLPAVQWNTSGRCVPSLSVANRVRKPGAQRRG